MNRLLISLVCMSRFVALVVAMCCLVAVPTVAAPLNVNAFASLGVFPSQSGTYTFSWNSQTGQPYLAGPAGTITGTTFGSVAVYAFDTITVSAGMVLLGGGNTPAVALLSKGDLTMSGRIDFRGGNGLQGTTVLNTTGTAGPGGNSGGYGGRGDGSGSVVGGGGGGGYGGAGGRGGQTPFFRTYYGAGGSSFGNLATSVEGGGNGGLGGHVLASIYNGAGGGGSGGVIELGANGLITIGGQGVLASGGNGGIGSTNASQPAGGGGGGAGGGVLIHGDFVSVLSSIDVRGGDGGISRDDSRAGGGGGGGGRVYVGYASGFSGSSNVLLSGGIGSGDALPGSAGVITAIPEPTNCGLILAGLWGTGLWVWGRRKRA
jgi:hypothetical protein